MVFLARVTAFPVRALSRSPSPSATEAGPDNRLNWPSPPLPLRSMTRL